MVQVEKKFEALGTLNTITLWGEEHQKKQLLDIAHTIRDWVWQLDDRLSVFKESSETARMNAMAGRQMMDVSEEVRHLVETARVYCKKTEGRFTITAGALCQLWRKALKTGKLPEEALIRRAMKQTGDSSIRITEEGKIGLRRKGQSVDFGGIAKGYAVDTARNMLQDAGVKEACLNFGGTVYVLGREMPVGIQNPLEATGKAFSTIQVCNQAVVTSGIYERCTEIEGRRSHHIIDPTTGYPADTGILSVTVVGNEAEKLDALATSILLCGTGRGAELLREDGAEGIIILENGKVFATSGVVLQNIALQNTSENTGQ